MILCVSVPALLEHSSKFFFPLAHVVVISHVLLPGSLY